MERWSDSDGDRFFSQEFKAEMERRLRAAGELDEKGCEPGLDCGLIATAELVRAVPSEG